MEKNLEQKIEERINNFLSEYDLVESFGDQIRLNAQETSDPLESVESQIEEIKDELNI